MPLICFGYSSDTPATPDPRQMVNTACFGYPPGAGRHTGSSCFSYPADVRPGAGKHDVAEPVPPGLRRMPTTSCFRY